MLYFGIQNENDARIHCNMSDPYTGLSEIIVYDTDDKTLERVSITQLVNFVTTGGKLIRTEGTTCYIYTHPLVYGEIKIWYYPSGAGIQFQYGCCGLFFYSQVYGILRLADRVYRYVPSKDIVFFTWDIDSDIADDILTLDGRAVSININGLVYPLRKSKSGIYVSGIGIIMEDEEYILSTLKSRGDKLRDYCMTPDIRKKLLLR